MARPLDYTGHMKPSLALRAVLITAVAAACTPIAPSVHKSVLRVGESENSRASPVPAPQAIQRVVHERRDGTLKVSWVRDDEALEHELGSQAPLKRASDEEVAELKQLSDGRIMMLSLPEEGTVSEQSLRVVVRIQLASSRLEELRPSEEASWNFWLHESRKTIAVSQTLEKSQLGASILNVYLVSEKQEKPELPAQPVSQP